MNAPIQDNPYGVYVPGSRQSLPGFAVPPRDDHPLVPWEDESHAGQWVDVDHAREQLDLFEQCLLRLADLVTPGVDQGRLVVVTGPVGMGKTTLIHQCIYRAGQYIARLNELVRTAPPGTRRPPRHIVAMTAGYGNDGRAISIDENGDFASTPTINATIRDKVVATLRTQLAGAGLDPALSQESPLKAFNAISALLAQHDALLFAVVPHIDWKDVGVRTRFLKTCLSHAQSRIVLLVEVSHGTTETANEVVAELLPSAAVTHLALGSLRPEDTLKFSQSARSGHPDPDSAPPRTAQGLRDELLRAHEQWQPADVRELRRVFHAVAEGQRHAGRPVRITADELTRHTSGRSGPDLATLRRTTPGPTALPHPPGPSTGS
ncbi:MULTISPECIES: hypothetical protein [unclassified Streptomyces]|uniref:hypothetical protein n=1 Tax=unclassified Streptomyces TaxID=2593676 RepID=UPI002E808A9A|nr:hypothetical protein [Streptomyces sp. NBC_00589]WTI40450.1 hypothetical protein OIC96_38380 [Streptomyces sp. NBC_00775]WUB25866.1 hypothetical protein OHA51_11350 [Streptomyces sp. NBC_00589]